MIFIIVNVDGTVKKGESMPQLKKTPAVSSSCVVVLDFDYTLTDQHTGGRPQPQQEGIMSAATVQIVRQLLEMLSANHTPVYINTRGNIFKIGAFLANKGIGPDLVRKIKGAVSDEEIADPYRNDKLFDAAEREMRFMRFRGDESTVVWAFRKQQILQEIQHDEKVPPSRIYFFDDTAVNIRAAKIFGFVHSYVVRPGNVRAMAEKVMREIAKA